MVSRVRKMMAALSSRRIRAILVLAWCVTLVSFWLLDRARRAHIHREAAATIQETFGDVTDVSYGYPLWLRKLPYGSEISTPVRAFVFGMIASRQLPKLGLVYEVHLRCDRDEEMAYVVKCPYLRQLSLSGNAGDEALAGMENLRHLWQVFLQDNGNIRGPGLRHLAGLTALERLYLNGTNVDGKSLAWLVPLDNLSMLAAGRTRLTDDAFEHLGKFPALEELLLGSNAIQGRGLGYLQALKHLKTLDLGGTEIDDLGIAELPDLPALEQLDLSYTKITDKGAATLERRVNLKQLSIVGTQVSHLMADRLQQSLKNTEVARSRPPQPGHRPADQDGSGIAISFVVGGSDYRPTLAISDPVLQLAIGLPSLALGAALLILPAGKRSPGSKSADRDAPSRGPRLLSAVAVWSGLVLLSIASALLSRFGTY